MVRRKGPVGRKHLGPNKSDNEGEERRGIRIKKKKTNFNQ